MVLDGSVMLPVVSATGRWKSWLKTHSNICLSDLKVQLLSTALHCFSMWCKTEEDADTGKLFIFGVAGIQRAKPGRQRWWAQLQA